MEGTRGGRARELLQGAVARPERKTCGSHRERARSDTRLAPLAPACIARARFVLCVYVLHVVFALLPVFVMGIIFAVVLVVFVVFAPFSRRRR